MNTIKKVAYEDLDMEFLTRELDRTKSELFTHKYAAFYGSLLCSMNFHWTTDIKTAATDGVSLLWNPYWFLKLTPKARVTVLMHEIQHPARLHFIRQGERDPKIWNFACDIRINNDLTDQGYSFHGVEDCWRTELYPSDTVEEDIYDDLIKLGISPNGNAWGDMFSNESGGPYTYEDDDGDMAPKGPMTVEDMAQAVNNVVRAAQQSQLAGMDELPGGAEKLLKQFLAPVVPWEQVLHRFMQDLKEHGYSWRKPNRRHCSLYLPSRYEEEGALEHLAYFEDTSGSITDKDALRFNSEFKFVKEQYEPEKMTLIQFDTIIQDERVYMKEDPFEQVVIKGGGGTSLYPVREWIIKNKPTAAIVFSDMQCAPMEALEFEVPIIWICISNRNAQVPFGQIVHIR